MVKCKPCRVGTNPSAVRQPVTLEIPQFILALCRKDRYFIPTSLVHYSYPSSVQFDEESIKSRRQRFASLKANGNCKLTIAFKNAGGARD